MEADTENDGDRGPRVSELDALRQDCRAFLDNLGIEDLRVMHWLLSQLPSHRLRAELEAATAGGFEAPGDPRVEAPCTPALVAKGALWSAWRKAAPLSGVQVAPSRGGSLGVVAAIRLLGR